MYSKKLAFSRAPPGGLGRQVEAPAGLVDSSCSTNLPSSVCTWAKLVWLETSSKKARNSSCQALLSWALKARPRSAGSRPVEPAGSIGSVTLEALPSVGDLDTFLAR